MSLFFAYAEYESKLYFEIENRQINVKISFMKKHIKIMQSKKAVLETFLINI